MSTNEPTSKRPRVEDDDSSLDHVMSSRVFQEVDILLKSFQSAFPYPHGIIKDFFMNGFLGI